MLPTPDVLQHAAIEQRWTSNVAARCFRRTALLTARSGRLHTSLLREHDREVALSACLI